MMQGTMNPKGGHSHTWLHLVVTLADQGEYDRSIIAAKQDHNCHT